MLSLPTDAEKHLLFVSEIKEIMIFNNSWYEQRLSTAIAERPRIVKTAVAITGQDIRSKPFETDLYATSKKQFNDMSVARKY